MITPDSYQFGEAFIPCGSTVELQMRNAGSEDLVITDLAYTSGGELSVPALDSVRAQLPLTLGPGESTHLVVEYAPASAGSDTGILEVFSNDPAGVETADQNGEGAYLDEAAEQFVEPPQPAVVDIVFLVDQSGSMNENEADFRNGIPPFMDELQNATDWQLILVNQDNGCNTGGLLDASVPDADQIFVDNVFNSTSISKTEKLLSLADTALGRTGPGGCNDGALRPDAQLHIIVASDEKDQSSNTWSHWVSQYEGYVASPDHVTVSAIVDIHKNCGLGGNTDGPGGYINAADYTGGSVIDICQAGWGHQLTDIAGNIAEGVGIYTLTEPADASTIVVVVGGVVATDWTYDPSTNSLTIHSPAVEEGDVVDIAYNVLAECG